ncbi:MAG: hypothetical protein Kow00107_10430 [Planctomycetota bacterium]
MPFLRCPNPKCGAEFEDLGDEYPVCPFCGEEIFPGGLPHSPSSSNKLKIALMGAAVGLVLLGVSIVIILLVSGGGAPKQTPSPVAALSDNPTPSPEATESVAPSETPTPAPTPSPSPSPSPSETPALSPAATPAEPEATPEPEPSVPPVSEKVQSAIAEAKRLADGGEYVRAISELETALKTAATNEERDALNALIRRYKRLASRQFFLNEAERLLNDKKYVASWCNFERARSITPIPIEPEIVEKFREAARKITESSFESSDKVRVNAIPGGTFEMGSRRGMPDEEPIHKVTLSPYWMMETEVTNALFKQAVEAEVVRAPKRLFSGTSIWTDEGFPKLYESHPVVGVTWEDAVNYCKWLTEREHEAFALPKFMSYVLPTEAMWERAAGGPRQSLYPWFQGSPERNAVFGKWGLYGVESVRTRYSNEFGLYDMGGNAAEWCSDWYGPYDKAAQTDPTGPPDGEHKVLRGGSYLATEFALRVTARFHLAPHYRVGFVGFRPAVRITDEAAWKKACGE